MGKIDEVLKKCKEVVNELMTQENVKDEKEAEAVLKKLKIEWDSKKSTQDGVVYFLKKKEVATYDDQFDALTIISGKGK